MTEDEKFEERVRMIVRDELEAEMIYPKGWLDEIRQATFNMVKAILIQQAERTIASFDPPGGEAKSEGKGA